MKTNPKYINQFKYYKFKILVLFSSVILTGCTHQNNNCLPFTPIGEIPVYVFEVPVKIYPQNKSLKLGDTLFIRVVMDDSIFEKNIVEKYKLENYPFYLTPRFEKISDNVYYKATYFTQSAQNEIDVVMVKGLSQHPDTINNPYGRRGLLNYYFSYTSPKYELILALIPKKQGTYLIDFIDMEIPKQSFPFVCSYRNIAAQLNVNNGKSNYEMLQQKTSGSLWHITQEHKYGGTYHTLWHDTLKRYKSEPRLLSFDYCFTID